MLKLGDRLKIFNYIGEVVTGSKGYYINFTIIGKTAHGITCDRIAHTINPGVYCFIDLLEEDNTYDGLYIVKSKHCFFPEFDSLEKLEEFINKITGKEQK